MKSFVFFLFTVSQVWSFASYGHETSEISLLFSEVKTQEVAQASQSLVSSETLASLEEQIKRAKLEKTRNEALLMEEKKRTEMYARWIKVGYAVVGITFLGVVGYHVASMVGGVHYSSQSVFTAITGASNNFLGSSKSVFTAITGASDNFLGSSKNFLETTEKLKTTTVKNADQLGVTINENAKQLGLTINEKVKEASTDLVGIITDTRGEAARATHNMSESASRATEEVTQKFAEQMGDASKKWANAMEGAAEVVSAPVNVGLTVMNAPKAFRNWMVELMASNPTEVSSTDDLGIVILDVMLDKKEEGSLSMAQKVSSMDEFAILDDKEKE